MSVIEKLSPIKKRTQGELGLKGYIRDTLKNEEGFTRSTRAFSKEAIEKALGEQTKTETPEQEVTENENTLAEDNEEIEEGAKPDFLDIDKDGNKKESMKAASKDRKGMKKGGMAKGMAKGGMKKKAYAKGGKVMTYNVGGMVKSQGKMNTGIRMAKGGAMGGMKKGMK